MLSQSSQRPLADREAADKKAAAAARQRRIDRAIPQVERLLSSSRAVEAKSRFLDGTEREYTRDVWYADEEGDFRADDYNVPVEEARRGPKTRISDVWGNDDTFEESGYRPMVAEKAHVIEQLRQDIGSDLVQERVAQRRLKRADAPLATRDDAKRAQAAILQAMATRQSRQLLFSFDYAGSVPPEMRADFLATLEVETIELVLLPNLLTVWNGGYVHTLESAAIRELESVGCRLANRETLTVDAWPPPLADRLPAPNHWHIDRRLVRILTFLIPTANAIDPDDADANEDLSLSSEDEDMIEDRKKVDDKRKDPRGYHVRVIYGIVEEFDDDADDDDDDDKVEKKPIRDTERMLCFRAFQFSR